MSVALPGDRWVVPVLVLVFVVGLPALNLVPGEGSVWHVSDYTLNLFGKFLAYAILALGLDLLWGYTGILSLGHGVFFCLGGYAMAMHLMLEIGADGVYQSTLPDFMVWNQVTELPWFWRPFDSGAFSLAAVVMIPALFAWGFGVLAFRSRIKGVYFAVITQALALSMWLLFNRNELNLGGTNGLADFKTVFGFSLREASTQRVLYLITAVSLVAAYLACRGIARSALGRILMAIRDSEGRVRFSGYDVSRYKLFVWTVSAVLAGIAGALYVPQVGIITPGKMGVLPSIEMIIWVAVGGRGTLYGAVLGAIGVNWLRSVLTESYPDVWLFVLGGLFVAVVMFVPDGMAGLPGRVGGWVRRRRSLGDPVMKLEP